MTGRTLTFNFLTEYWIYSDFGSRKRIPTYVYDDERCTAGTHLASNFFFLSKIIHLSLACPSTIPMIKFVIFLELLGSWSTNPAQHDFPFFFSFSSFSPFSYSSKSKTQNILFLLSQQKGIWWGQPHKFYHTPIKFYQQGFSFYLIFFKLRINGKANLH